MRMKFAEFGGAEFFLADEQNHGLFREPSSPFFDKDCEGNFFAFSLTVVLPGLKERAWLFLPYDDDSEGFEAAVIANHFLKLLKKGCPLSRAGEEIKNRYFNEKDYSQLFEKHSSYNFDLTLKETAV